ISLAVLFLGLPAARAGETAAPVPPPHPRGLSAPAALHASYQTYAAGLHVADVQAGFSLGPWSYRWSLPTTPPAWSGSSTVAISSTLSTVAGWNANRCRTNSSAKGPGGDRSGSPASTMLTGCR